MVHYHQQALQDIMLTDIFEVCCINVAITNPVCKKKSMLSLIEISGPSPMQRMSSLFSFPFHFPLLLFIRTGIVMEST